MNIRKYLPIPLALTMAIAFVGALAAVAVSGSNAASAHPNASHHAMHVSRNGVKISKKELALRQELRRLWEDHVTWTRLAVISLTSDSPDTRATVGRLLENQTDIGNTVKPYYGANAGKQLTALLREHILIAADLIAAARSGDQARVASEQARWTNNADRIASFLSKANPRFWKLGEMKTMMHHHLRLTTNEVVARLERNWTADVRAYDRIHLQALHMADMLSSGLVAQFPGRFR
jgi:hypothetical protein